MKPLLIPCQLHRDHAGQLEQFFHTLLKQSVQATHEPYLLLNCEQIESLDSVGAALLWRWDQRAQQQGQRFKLLHLAPGLQRKLATMPTPQGGSAMKQTRILESPSKDRSVGVLQDLGQIGPLLHLLVKDLFWGKQWSRSRFWQRVAYDMLQLGANAWLIIGVISLLVGATIALQSAAQLRMFGANLFVTDLLTISILRELGPLMAAIVLAGRSGSAIAAQVGTMVMAEEMDALRTMGISGPSFVILPKCIALLLAQPLLTCLANCLGILGGGVVTMVYMDVSFSAFWERFLFCLAWKDIATGLIKSMLFALCTVMLAATSGLGTQGGPEGVGKSTTNSVVRSLFAIIAADAILSLVFYLGE